MISRSGVDKSTFVLEDLIQIDAKGNILTSYQKPGISSSAETEIHTEIYKRFPEINCVLHTHSVLGTVLSQIHQSDKALYFEGWEILKGLSGNTTHEMNETLPIVPNSQKMSDILNAIEPELHAKTHGFLIAGHGLYTWGKDITTAKRHIETFEFLFECFHTMKTIGR